MLSMLFHTSFNIITRILKIGLNPQIAAIIKSFDLNDKIHLLGFQTSSRIVFLRILH